MSLYCYASNLLTEALILPSSMVPVQMSPNVERWVAGSATMSVRGAYTDTINRSYRVMISYADDTTFTYRWDWSDTGGTTWNAVDVPLLANTWHPLNNGLEVQFVAGSYIPQLVVGDTFRWHVERPYRPALALDLKRESELRSGAIGAGGTYIVTFPFAVTTAPQAMILFDHNIPSGATIRLQGSTVSNFASTPFNNVIPWAANKMLYRIPGAASFAYWRLHITVVGAVNYIGMSGLYLGAEIAFTREFDLGFRKSLTIMGGSDDSVLARGPGRYGLQPQRYELTFGHRSPTDDLNKFETLWNLTHPTRQDHRPFYFYFDSVPSLPIFELFHLQGDLSEAHNFLERMTPVLNLLQVIRTAA